MRDVAIIGVGITRFGEIFEKSLRGLFVEASLNALDNAGVDHLDAMYVGCMSGGLFTGQEHIGPLLADYLGQCPIPATRVESACASGGLAVRTAFLEVASGQSDIVLAGGVEKMTDVSGDDATYALATAADQEWESFNGITFPGLYAMMARAHMHRYGTTSEQLAAVAVKNHHHGSMNPVAQYPHEVTVEQVLNSVLVADPLHILDCSPITDGAAAVILCAADRAKELTEKLPVRILASTQASDTMALHDREDMTTIKSTVEASARAYKAAGKSPSDIDLCEIHDCFTISEIVVSESLGFFDAGKGASAVEGGETAIGGRLPINTSGGLKSKGHPVGASGVAQIVEIVEQLRGESGKRQVQDARVGMTQNMGGSGASSVVHILEAM